jgi:hypothetical protein
MKINEDGYTIPEMVTVLVITSTLVTLILFFTFSYWRYGSLLEADLETLVSRLNAGDSLRELVGSSSGMIIQNSIPDSNTENPDPAFPSNLYWLPIHAVPGNKTASPGTMLPVTYIRKPSVTTANTVAMNGAQPFEDEFIVYLNGTTKQLLLRSLANPSVSNNKLKTSCPPAIATNACPADKIISGDVASVDMRYFSRTGNLIDFTSVTDAVTGEYIGPDFTVVDVAEYTLNITKKPFLQKTNATVNKTTVRIALRNT